MITEDYVSFDIAKLLKEKGFDWGCQYCYIDEDDSDKEQLEVPTGYDAEIDAPTLQMAMKWLRKVHNIFIQIELYSKYDNYCFELFQNTHRLMVEHHEVYNSYEEAGEAAIKYCLEKLV